MKVLVVSQYFWPESFRINEVVLSMVGVGADVSVLTGNPNYPEGKVFPGHSAFGYGRSEWSGARIYRVPIFPRGSGGAWRLALNYVSFVTMASTLGLILLRKVPIDVIYVYAPSPILQALPAILFRKVKAAPLVLNVQDLWPESLRATGYIKNLSIIRLVEHVVRYIYKNSDRILVSSEPFSKRVLALSPNASVFYYPNSVGRTYSNLPDPATLPLPDLDGCFCVAFAGNLGSAQALDTLIEAASILKTYSSIRIVVYGHGSRFAWLKRMKEERSLSNLHLMGRHPEESMPYLLANASALLVTLADSPIFRLTVPNKIQAYLAMGKPIIACLNGEGGRIVEEASAGLVVPAERPEALARAVVELSMKSEDERRAMGRAGRAYYQTHFDNEKLMSKLLEHLSTVVAAKK